MVLFPKIKKEALDFVSDEDGRISQRSIVRLGFVAVGFVGLSGVAAAQGVISGTVEDGRIGYVCDDGDDFSVGEGSAISVTCYDSIEKGDVTLKLSMPSSSVVSGMNMDINMTDNCEAEQQMGNWIAEQYGNEEQMADLLSNGVVTDKRTSGCEDHTSNEYPSEVKFDTLLHQHENNIILESDEGGAELSGSHDHSIFSYCQDVRITANDPSVDDDCNINGISYISALPGCDCSNCARAVFTFSLEYGGEVLCDNVEVVVSIDK